MEALLVSTGVVALAEIGDKTQLLALTLAARYCKPISISLGIAAATLANHALAAALGAWLAGQIDPEILRWLLAASFLGMALWLLIPDRLEDAPRTKASRGVFTTTLVLFFLVEMGDKTQVATVALALQYQTVGWVLLGTTLGMLAANVPAVLLGERLARRLPSRTLHALAAAIFLGFGVALALG